MAGLIYWHAKVFFHGERHVELWATKYETVKVWLEEYVYADDFWFANFDTCDAEQAKRRGCPLWQS